MEIKTVIRNRKTTEGNNKYYKTEETNAHTIHSNKNELHTVCTAEEITQLLHQKDTQRFDKSHICPDHPRSATPHQRCCVGWGPRHSQPSQVSSKSVQGFWLPEKSKSAIFLCLVLWLI